MLSSLGDIPRHVSKNKQTKKKVSWVFIPLFDDFHSTLPGPEPTSFTSLCLQLSSLSSVPPALVLSSSFLFYFLPPQGEAIWPCFCCFCCCWSRSKACCEAKKQRNMGGGISIDSSSFGVVPANTRYYCHACRNIFSHGMAVRRVEMCCPRCQSSFLEEFSTQPITASHQSPFQMFGTRQLFSGGSQRNRSLQPGDLTEDQARRLANAAIMLRLLEAQLRDELEALQLTFATTLQNSAAAAAQRGPKPLSQIMLDKIGSPELSLDMICDQPSCPICSEDFEVGLPVTQLPCSHIFHHDCVMPWLESKRTCPICRFFFSFFLFARKLSK